MTSLIIMRKSLSSKNACEQLRVVRRVMLISDVDPLSSRKAIMFYWGYLRTRVLCILGSRGSYLWDKLDHFRSCSVLDSLLIVLPYHSSYHTFMTYSTFRCFISVSLTPIASFSGTMCGSKRTCLTRRLLSRLSTARWRAYVNVRFL